MSADISDPLFADVLQSPDADTANIVTILKKLHFLLDKAKTALSSKQEHDFLKLCDEIASMVLSLENQHKHKIVALKQTQPLFFSSISPVIEHLFTEVVSLNLQSDILGHQTSHQLAFLSRCGKLENITTYNQQGSYQLQKNYQ